MKQATYLFLLNTWKSKKLSVVMGIGRRLGIRQFFSTFVIFSISFCFIANNVRVLYACQRMINHG